jgi:hypothetical protein
MTVKAIKLVSGEELVGEVVHEDKGNDGFIEEISLKNVLAIMIQRDREGNLNVGFVPFAPYLGKDVTFDFKHDKLLFVKEVDVQMANQYNAIFGGIVTPPKSLILG